LIKHENFLLQISTAIQCDLIINVNDFNSVSTAVIRIS